MKASADSFHASRFTFQASPLVYEINTRCWLRRLSDRNGEAVTLNNVPDSEFERWQRLGFSHLWLMGVWTTGPRSRALALATAESNGFGEAFRNLPESDVAGSPYSIAAYRVPEQLGGEIGLRQFRRRLHERGMKLILDFVPNHVGLDHPWLNGHPELFVQSPARAPGTFVQETRAGPRHLAHGRDPNFPPWTDTAQLDYRLASTRAAMQEELLGVADRCDGVRCDMAMLLLNEVFAKTWAGFPSPEGGTPNGRSEFWADAIAAAKRAHPGCLFLAEVYWGLEPRLQELGFDYTYDKELYDWIVRRHPEGVPEHLLRVGPEGLERGAHFLENHDEARVASLLPLAEHRAAALLILALPGMRLLHDGQLDGARVKVPVQICRAPDEAQAVEITSWYEQLLGVLKNSAAGRGRAALLEPREAWPGNPTARNFVVVQWPSESPELELAVVNLAPHRSQCYAPLRSPDLAKFNWRFRDLLGAETFERSGNDLSAPGLYLDLAAHGTQWLRCAPIGSLAPEKKRR